LPMHTIYMVCTHAHHLHGLHSHAGTISKNLASSCGVRLLRLAFAMPPKAVLKLPAAKAAAKGRATAAAKPVVERNKPVKKKRSTLPPLTGPWAYIAVPLALLIMVPGTVLPGLPAWNDAFLGGYGPTHLLPNVNPLAAVAPLRSGLPMKALEMFAGSAHWSKAMMQHGWDVIS